MGQLRFLVKNWAERCYFRSYSKKVDFHTRLFCFLVNPFWVMCCTKIWPCIEWFHLEDFENTLISRTFDSVFFISTFQFPLRRRSSEISSAIRSARWPALTGRANPKRSPAMEWRLIEVGARSFWKILRNFPFLFFLFPLENKLCGADWHKS